jgi:hypothetical protein
MNTTSPSENEKLLLRSLDISLSDKESETLKKVLLEDSRLPLQTLDYLRVRELLARKNSETFGPFFGERVINQLKKRTKEIDYLIFYFFKKYQVVALGVLVALLTANILLADQLSLESVFGYEEETLEDIISIDVYQNLNP